MELVINHVTKHYKKTIAVDDFNLTITPGVWGLLGANGAGKTTLMRIICGILTPDTGEILYNDVPIDTLGEKYRDIFGYLPQEFGFYPEFSVYDYLQYIAVFKGLSSEQANEKIANVLETLALTNVKKKKIRKLSGGTQRRVGIAQALLNDPSILVFDEPTSGLDPGERVHFRKIITELGRKCIVLISTHIVSDVEYMATQNIIMKDGKKIRIGTTEKLITEMNGLVWECIMSNSDFSSYESNLKIVNTHNEEDGHTRVRYVSDCPYLPNSQLIQPRLEDLYLWLFNDRGGAHEL